MQPVARREDLIFFMRTIELVLPATHTIGINLSSEGEFFLALLPLDTALFMGEELSSAVFFSSAFYNRKKLPVSKREEQVQLPGR